MILNTKIIKKLRKALPPGFGPELQRRLQKRGLNFTLAYIYQVLSPENPKSNCEIVDEAITYLQELRDGMNDVEAKITSLT